MLKVKYGASPEVHTEVAATRLMHALGAGADRMYLVDTLRCFGCPEDPYPMLRCFSSPFEERVRQCGQTYGDKTPDGKVVVRSTTRSTSTSRPSRSSGGRRAG